MIKDGELNPIFELCSYNMKELIGIDKQELVEKYYIDKRERGI